MLSQVLSWVIPAVGLVAFWLCARYPWGWFVGIGQQALYLAYAFITRQWGFLFHSFLYTIVFARNFILDEKTLRLKREKKARKAAKKAKHEGADVRGHSLPYPALSDHVR